MNEDYYITTESTIRLNDQFTATVTTRTLDFDKVFENIADGIDKIMNADTDLFSELCKIANINPQKGDLRWRPIEGLTFDAGNFFEHADFRDTAFIDTIWEDGMSTYGIRLEGANLLGLQNISEERLAPTYIDDKTILPEGMDREKIKALHKALNMPPPPSDQVSGAPSPAP